MSQAADLTLEATVNVQFGPLHEWPAVVSVPDPDLVLRAYIDVPEAQSLGVAVVSVHA